MLTSTTDCINAYSTSLSSLSNPSVTTNIFATYPPPNIPIPPPSKGLNPIFCDATTTSVKDKGKAILIEEVAQHGNTSSKTFKMQVDPGNFRSVLKRCRNNTGNSKGVNQEALGITLSAISSTITDEVNLFLTQNFTQSEVDDALFSMAPDKSPVIDGLTLIVLNANQCGYIMKDK
ncbi:hypothetical protein G4B88_030440 [Cannabis sativa]|uniref:Uncharacterized protein n=1 Tax=Cannabis sativa TaxID=3483 RepID=A0A7J6F6C0_CANSA|nr:hypothetical protein G4B88_030440 [Cannabis sativa]